MSTVAQCFLAAFCIAIIVGIIRSIENEPKPMPRPDEFTAWGDC